MKKITLLLIVVMALAVLALTSCSAKTVTVRVLDGEQNIICDQIVELGAENSFSIQEKNFYAIDCLDAALKQEGIEYTIDTVDAEAFAVVMIDGIFADKTNQFVYYRQDNAKGAFENKTGLTAQHDEMEGGEVLEFRYETVQKEEAK